MKQKSADSFCIEMAGVPIQVVPYSPKLRDACQEYLCACTVAGIPIVCLSQDDVEHETEVSVAYYGYPVGNELDLEKLALLRKVTEVLCSFDTLLVHASALALDGKAYLFAAPSGTGKSTHARMWRECFGERVHTINDDKPFVRCFDDKILVYGNIWNGKENLGNKLVAPLAGIVCLEQGTDNAVIDMNTAEKHVFLYRQTHLSRQTQNRINTLRLIDTIMERTPIIKLHCTPTHEAAQLCYQALKEQA